MSHEGIILARSGDRLMRCVVCRKPTVPAEIAPMDAQTGICAFCWERAAKLRNWMMQPSLGNSGVPVLQVMGLLIGLCKDRAEDVGPVRTLVRMIEEREQIQRQALSLPDEGPACCYCHLAEPEEGGEELLVAVAAEDGLPAIWHCKDIQACDARLFQRLMLLVAHTVEMAKAANAVAGMTPQ